MANGDLHPCSKCFGDGFRFEMCNCREAACRHEAIFRTPDSEEQSGLYQKFWVRRTDGTSREGAKHHACDYFVLDWVHDRFAPAAAMAYATACEATHPELAADLRARSARALKRWATAESIAVELQAKEG